MPKHTAKKGRRAIGRKIKKLKREGKSQKQAVGQALGTARAGGLGSGAKKVVKRRPRGRSSR